MNSSPLMERSYAAAYQGSRHDAKAVFNAYASSQSHWTPETRRARWDGAAALLEWWHTLSSAQRPPLDDLNRDNARAFIRSLEFKGLARSTIKSYRVGASAFTKALRWGRGLSLDTYPHYEPFEGVLPAKTKPKLPIVDRAKLAALPDVRTRAKLEALLTLLELGLATSDACTRYWSDVSLERRELTGYRRHQRLELSTEALEALGALWEVLPKVAQSKNRRVFGWNPSTARRWLKQVR